MRTFRRKVCAAWATLALLAAATALDSGVAGEPAAHATKVRREYGPQPIADHGRYPFSYFSRRYPFSYFSPSYRYPFGYRYNRYPDGRGYAGTYRPGYSGGSGPGGFAPGGGLPSEVPPDFGYGGLSPWGLEATAGLEAYGPTDSGLGSYGGFFSPNGTGYYPFPP
jgi:hypothetical protein